MASYNTLKKETLIERARLAADHLGKCNLCPRVCNVNRLLDEMGFCHTGRLAQVASYTQHFGEEDCLVGTKGSGTIFFSGCNMGCVYCQNYEISQENQGSKVTKEELARMMLTLQDAGCHNINFVTPTHVVPEILEALVIARDEGLNVPLVYNSGGYDSIETLRLLDGIFDIYMPDAKYGNDIFAQKYSLAKGYTGFMKAAILEMHRQVGDLIINEEGIATRGLLVRHLVLPGDLGESREIIRFLAREISPNTYLNIMPQYRPMYMADRYPELKMSSVFPIYLKALKYAAEMGLVRGLANP